MSRLPIQETRPAASAFLQSSVQANRTPLLLPIGIESLSFVRELAAELTFRDGARQCEILCGLRCANTCGSGLAKVCGLKIEILDCKHGWKIPNLLNLLCCAAST